LLRFTGLLVAPFPLRPRLFRFAKNALVTSGHSQMAAIAAGFRLWLGGGTLRFDSDTLNAALRPPLHFPRSPTADRSLKVYFLYARCAPQPDASIPISFSKHLSSSVSISGHATKIE